MITSMSASGPCLMRFSSSMPSSLGIFRSVTTTSKRPCGELFEGFLAVGGRDHLVPLRGQIVGQGDAFDFFVVDDEDSHGLSVRNIYLMKSQKIAR